MRRLKQEYFWFKRNVKRDYNHSLEVIQNWVEENTVMFVFLDKYCVTRIMQCGVIYTLYKFCKIFKNLHLSHKTGAFFSISLNTLDVNFEIQFMFDRFRVAIILMSLILSILCFIWLENDLEANQQQNCLLMLVVILVLIFTTNDFFSFIVLFEASLIPLYLLIVLVEGKKRRFRAAYYLYFYTGISGLCLILATILLWQEFGIFTFDTLLLLGLESDSPILYVIWILLFIAFGIKIPFFPCHVWLPEAHVEAPTVGSVILAAVILKMGLFGMLVVLKPFAYITHFFLPLVETIGCYSVLISLAAGLISVDIKRIVAYSSIAHMNIALIAVLVKYQFGYIGGVYMLFAHGFVSAGLFFMIGSLYLRCKTKTIFYIAGLADIMPKFVFFWFFFLLSNNAFPPTFNFISELFMFIGIFKENVYVTAILSISLIFNVLIFSKLFNMLSFGVFKKAYFKTVPNDLIARETVVLLILLTLVFIYGIFPPKLFII